MRSVLLDYMHRAQTPVVLSATISDLEYATYHSPSQKHLLFVRGNNDEYPRPLEIQTCSQSPGVRIYPRLLPVEIVLTSDEIPDANGGNHSRRTRPVTSTLLWIPVPISEIFCDPNS